MHVNIDYRNASHSSMPQCGDRGDSTGAELDDVAWAPTPRVCSVVARGAHQGVTRPCPLVEHVGCRGLRGTHRMQGRSDGDRVGIGQGRGDICRVVHSAKFLLRDRIRHLPRQVRLVAMGILPKIIDDGLEVVGLVPEVIRKRGLTREESGAGTPQFLNGACGRPPDCDRPGHWLSPARLNERV